MEKILRLIGIKIFTIDSPYVAVPKQVLSIKDNFKINIIFLIIGIIIGTATALRVIKFYATGTL